MSKIKNLIENEDLESLSTLSASTIDEKITKTVALLMSSNYEEALKLTEEPEMKFLRAYALYRTAEFQAAYNLISEERKPKYLHLKGLLLYRLERYEEAIKVYRHLGEEDDIETNVSACKALAGIPLEGSTFSSQFNCGCALIVAQEYQEAIRMLQKSAIKCQEEMLGEGSSIEEIDQELAIIHTQLGYCHQILGNITQASEFYGKAKSTNDPLIAAILSFNLLILQGSDPAKSKKALEDMKSKEVFSKLNTAQKEIIAYNYILAMMNLNEDRVGATINEMAEQYSKGDLVHLLKANNISKKKNPLAQLIEYAKANSHSLAAHLVLLQYYLNENNYQAMEKLLMKIKESNFDVFKRGINSLLIWVYEKTGQHQKAIKLLSNSKHINEDDKLKTALYKLRIGKFSEATQDFEQLYQKDPQNETHIAGLLVTGQGNDELITELRDKIKVQKVEGELQIMPQILSKPKKKKKRSKPVPKNFDPKKVPDPERWIPKKHRSTALKDSEFASQGATAEVLSTKLKGKGKRRK